MSQSYTGIPLKDELIKLSLPVSINPDKMYSIGSRKGISIAPIIEKYHVPDGGRWNTDLGTGEMVARLLGVELLEIM
jgi:hypothetical protein